LKPWALAEMQRCVDNGETFFGGRVPYCCAAGP
jgi:hypothetical protein